MYADLSKDLEQMDIAHRQKGEQMDLIDRQDAIDALSTPHGILYPIRTIEQLPSAQRTGRWKFDDKYVNRDDETIEIRRCSNCGFKHYYCQGNTALTDDAWFNFCPNCGVDMRGEQDG